MDHMTDDALEVDRFSCAKPFNTLLLPLMQAVCECLLATEFSSQVLELLHPAIQILLVRCVVQNLALVWMSIVAGDNHRRDSRSYQHAQQWES